MSCVPSYLTQTQTVRMFSVQVLPSTISLFVPDFRTRPCLQRKQQKQNKRRQRQRLNRKKKQQHQQQKQRQRERKMMMQFRCWHQNRWLSTQNSGSGLVLRSLLTRRTVWSGVWTRTCTWFYAFTLHLLLMYYNFGTLDWGSWGRGGTIDYL